MPNDDKDFWHPARWDSDEELDRFLAEIYQRRAQNPREEKSGAA